MKRTVKRVLFITLLIFLAIGFIALLVIGIMAPKEQGKTLLQTFQEIIEYEKVEVEYKPPVKVIDKSLFKKHTKTWANNAWLRDKVNIESIKKIEFTELDISPSEIAWVYDDISFKFKNETIYIKVNPGLKLQGSMRGAFENLPNLESIVGLEYVDTSAVQDMASMFKNCYKLTNIDFSELETDSVIVAANMFENCYELAEIKLTNTSNMIDTVGMFKDCRAASAITFGDLTPMDVTEMFYKVGSSSAIGCTVTGNINLSDVTSTNKMFYGSYLNDDTIIQSLDMSTVTETVEMFAYAKIPSVNLTNWNVQNLHNATRMFYACTGADQINISTWDVPKLRNCDEMLALTKIKTCSILWTNVKKLHSTNAMFRECLYITEIDLSGLNNLELGDTRDMLAYCDELHTVKCTSIYSDVSTNMFNQSEKLVGAVAYSDNSVDVSMANNQNGYFK